MHPPRWLFLVPILVASIAHAGTPAEAARIRQEFKLRSETWELQVKSATGPSAQQALLSKRPDVKEYAVQMWNCLSPSLAEDWTLEPAGWLLRVAPTLLQTDAKPAMIEALAKIREAVEKQHLRSPKLAPVCLGIAATQDPQALSLLQKIESENPDESVQGVAALGQAVLLRGLGDDPEVIKKRLTLLRKAIINSASLELDGVSVAKIAEDELYIILHLTKDRQAPELIGVDVANRPMTLSSYKGKVVVLVFWGTASTPDLDQFLEISSGLEKKFAGKPFALVGVSNDNAATLQELVSSGRVTWPNFSDPTNRLAEQYRVGSRPLAYVLDRAGKVRYSGTPGSFVELAVDAIFADSKPAAAGE
jgi:peroxiredoxin